VFVINLLVVPGVSGGYVCPFLIIEGWGHAVNWSMIVDSLVTIICLFFMLYKD
jgi:hypothetical protein